MSVRTKRVHIRAGIGTCWSPTEVRSITYRTDSCRCPTHPTATAAASFVVSLLGRAVPDPCALLCQRRRHATRSTAVLHSKAKPSRGGGEPTGAGAPGIDPQRSQCGIGVCSCRRNLCVGLLIDGWDRCAQEPPQPFISLPAAVGISQTPARQICAHAHTQTRRYLKAVFFFKS